MGYFESVDEDEADELIHAVGDPAVVARWEGAREQLREYQKQQAELQAEFDSLPIDEVRNRVAGALSSAVEVLRGTPIDEQLHSHGWTPEFAHGLADECERIRTMVEAGSYLSEWGGAGLGRWMQEEVDPKTTDTLKDAVHHAQSYLKAMSDRS